MMLLHTMSSYRALQHPHLDQNFCFAVEEQQAVFCEICCDLQDYGGEQAKMDLTLWMQEDGTGIFGALLFATDIFDAGTIQRMANNFVVRADDAPNQPSSLCGKRSSCGASLGRTGSSGQHRR